MDGYSLYLSDGDLLTTIPVRGVDNRANSSLVLIGKGVPDLWSAPAQNLVWMLENFSKTSPPPNPLVGQKWFDLGQTGMNVYDGQDWTPLLTTETSCDAEFDMLDTAMDIDITVAGSVPIFTVPDFTKTYLPTSLILVPRGPISATSPPTINLSAATAGDILSSTSIRVAHNGQFVRLRLNDAPNMVDQNFPTVFINITTPATGGDLVYDAYLYGLRVPFKQRGPISAAVEELAGAEDFPDAGLAYWSSVVEAAAAVDLSDARVAYLLEVEEAAVAEDLSDGLSGFGSGGYGIGSYGEP